MNPQEKFWKVASSVGIVLIIFLAVLSLKGLKSIGENDPVYNSISVNGKGEIVMIPDIATFSFSVTESAKTVAEVQTKATERTNSALKAVRDGGVADKDIKTTSYNINPKYEYLRPACTTFPCPEGRSVLTGYEVSQGIQVKVRDLSKAGALFESIGSVGVQNIVGLTFSIDDIEKVKADARALAIADAKVKAKELSKQLGVKLVKITSFYDSSNDPYYYGRAEGMGGDQMSLKAMPASIAPEIPTGEQKVISNVTVTYEIR